LKRSKTREKQVKSKVKTEVKMVNNSLRNVIAIALNNKVQAFSKLVTNLKQNIRIQFTVSDVRLAWENNAGQKHKYVYIKVYLNSFLKFKLLNLFPGSN
jgi:hypothetical protein